MEIVQPRYLAILVQQNWESELSVSNEGLYGCKLVLIGGIDRNDFQAISLVLRVHALDCRHFSPAWRTPACPEIDEKHLPLLICQAEVLTGIRFQGESWARKPFCGAGLFLNGVFPG